MKAHRLPLWSIIVLLSLATSLHAADHGIMIRVAHIYLNPDDTSQRLADITRGHEVAILEKSRNWLHVLASLSEERDVTGWILDKGVVTASTPNGDQVLFGAASDSEREAGSRGGRKGAAEDAMRLYARTQEYFPNSPLAGEALYRAADIRWQLDVEDYRTRPSAKERDPTLVPQIPEDDMRTVMKKFPHSKWSDLAAFHLLQNKMCGDWQGLPECPEKETGVYEKYVKEHPDSPAASEALYDAAYRQAALVQLYKLNNAEQKKIDAALANAKDLAQRAIEKNPQSDWAYRAQTLLYMVNQQMPVYGNVVQ
ncbi:MAG TPA: hypothetical protein VKW78_18280 [Terriglobales bacterium]|nr:hypothetical protein [Terriglobales bacterium]